MGEPVAFMNLINSNHYCKTTDSFLKTNEKTTKLSSSNLSTVGRDKETILLFSENVMMICFLKI